MALRRLIVHTNFKVMIQIEVMIIRNTVINWWRLYVRLGLYEKFGVVDSLER